MLESALAHLALGLRPIPVKARGKAPALSTWKEYQLRAPTEAELSGWFGGGWSGNVGTVIPPGWIVLDFDGGKPAEALLAGAGIALPESMPRVRSGSGGYHGYLLLPDGMPDFPKIPGSKFLSTGGAKPFVEVLTAGNFVVLPPSIHPNGQAYEPVVEFDGPPPAAPAALMALIAARRAPAPRASSPATANGNAPGWAEALSAGVPHGSIDDSMAKLAGYYLGRRLSEAQVVDILDSGFARRCTREGAPFRVPMADIRRVVASVARAEARKPDGLALDADAPFQCLGYDHEHYFYLSRATGQLVTLTARNHDGHNLLRIASLRHWESAFGTDRGVAWSAAQAKLLDAQHRVGVFDPERIRGRGAWWDESAGAVMHTGEELIIGGAAIPVRSAPPGRHVYELSRPLGVRMGEPLGAAGAADILAVFESLCWEHPHHARLAAGWCVVAAVCGAVAWRPHLWISGPSGSGKSWTVDHVIRRLLGGLALTTLSETTGAGLRQTLGHDARPIVFDEAEAEGARGGTRMAEVLALMRQSSSEGGGAIIKGSADGMARTYRVRSCFAMSSINVSAYQAADKNRITVLEMRVDPTLDQAERDARFAAVQARVASLLTEQFCASFRSRCVAMIPAIRRSAEVFAVVAASEIGSRRLGDQVGTLLAGAYALLSDDPIDPEHAAVLLAGQDLSEQKAIQSVSDEQDLLDRLLQHVARVRAPGGSFEEKSIATLLTRTRDSDSTGGPEAADALGLIGIRSEDEGFIVSNSHSGIARILEGTHWSRDWSRSLKRLHGARPSGVVKINGMARRGIFIPWDRVGYDLPERNQNVTATNP